MTDKADCAALGVVRCVLYGGDSKCGRRTDAAGNALYHAVCVRAADAAKNGSSAEVPE